MKRRLCWTGRLGFIVCFVIDISRFLGRVTIGAKAIGQAMITAGSATSRAIDQAGEAERVITAGAKALAGLAAGIAATRAAVAASAAQEFFTTTAAQHLLAVTNLAAIKARQPMPLIQAQISAVGVIGAQHLANNQKEVQQPPLR